MYTVKTRLWKPHVYYMKGSGEWCCRDIRCKATGDTKEKAYNRWLGYLEIFKGVTWDEKYNIPFKVSCALFQVPQTSCSTDAP